MKINKEKRKTLWIYAVILFTSAFIVLLLTAYSQIKLNESMSDIKSKLSSEESAKLNFKLNLNTAIEENKALSGELEKVKTEAEKQKKELEKQKKLVSDTNKNHNKTISSYEALVKAQMKYEDDELIECALLLKGSIDIRLLGSEARATYTRLSNASFEKAGRRLYSIGYKNFRNKKYVDAISNFQQSIKIIDKAYFSDDCYYYEAYCYFRQDNKTQAISLLEELIKKYPNSDYRADAEFLISRLRSQ